MKGWQMTHNEAILEMKKKWVGKQVVFEGESYMVVDVDSNYALMIDKPARFTETTAVSENMVSVKGGD